MMHQLCRALGRALQLDPIKPTLKAPGTKRSKLECNGLLSTFGFEFSLSRYSWSTATTSTWCTATSSRRTCW
jgi:hypothetical protein